MFLSKSKKLHWTYHARAKMAFYKLSEQRVRRVLNSPKRVEEGIAPKTIAMMQPSSVRRTTEGKSASLTYRSVSETVPSKAERSRGTPLRSDKFGNNRQETWNQEIWVMIQDEKNRRKIISAWRYPGRSKPRDEIMKNKIREAYNEYMKLAK